MAWVSEVQNSAPIRAHSYKRKETRKNRGTKTKKRAPKVNKRPHLGAIWSSCEGLWAPTGHLKAPKEGHSGDVLGANLGATRAFEVPRAPVGPPEMSQSDPQMSKIHPPKVPKRFQNHEKKSRQVRPRSAPRAPLRAQRLLRRFEVPACRYRFREAPQRLEVFWALAIYLVRTK